MSKYNLCTKLIVMHIFLWLHYKWLAFRRVKLPDIAQSIVTLLCLSTGVNMVKRKLAAHDNLKITIAQEGDKFNIKESSTFRNIEIEFTLGVTFEYALADGTELSVSS